LQGKQETRKEKGVMKRSSSHVSPLTIHNSPFTWGFRLQGAGETIDEKRERRKVAGYRVQVARP
jgi:hypothetical protein